MPIAQLNDSWSRRIDEASRWYAELQSDDLSPQDMDAFLAWQADPENEAAFQEVEHALLALDQAGLSSETVAPAPNSGARRGNGGAGARRISGGALRWISTGAVAAAVLVTASVFVVQSQFGADAVLYRTDIGEQRSVELADGSTVTLNTNSTIEVDYTDKARLVRLTEGQALFDVETDADRPFTVATDLSTTTALGTRFDVYAGKAQTAVTLIEGSVRVAQRDEGREGRGDADETEAVTLAPGEQALVSVNAPPTVGAVNVEAYTKWRDGVVQFTDTPLADAVAELNRYSRLQLRVQDKTLATERISGSFKAGQPEVFVSTLELFMPIRTVRIGDIIYISADGRSATPQE